MDRAAGHLTELFSGTDRARAIVGAELLSVALENALRAFMIGPEETVERLLNADNPHALLGAFGSRIALCSALGLMPQETESDLKLIARTRNDLAHKLARSFDTREIADRVATLSIVRRIKATPGPLATRTAYSAAAMSLLFQLDSIRMAVVDGARPAAPIDIRSAIWNETGFTIKVLDRALTLQIPLTEKGPRARRRGGVSKKR